MAIGDKVPAEVSQANATIGKLVADEYAKEIYRQRQHINTFKITAAVLTISAVAIGFMYGYAIGGIVYQPERTAINERRDVITVNSKRVETYFVKDADGKFVKAERKADGENAYLLLPDGTKIDYGGNK